MNTKELSFVLKRLVVTFAAIALVVPAFAAPKVTDVVAKQRFPWNGLVDITCNVSGFEGTTTVGDFAVLAVMPEQSEARKLSHFWVVRDGTNSTNHAVNTNGSYRLVWNAQADLGTVRYTNMVVRVVFERFGIRLWEDGPYWATTNIGAENPWDCGYYFWWGATAGYRRENNSWVYNEELYIEDSYFKNLETLRSEGWITSDNVLAPEHDAAHVQWGGDWRMPTDQELNDLCYYKCDWTWTTTNGVNGYIVRGRGDYASVSIFLPASGCVIDRASLSYANSEGHYWSSVPYPSNVYNSLCLYFNSDGRRFVDIEGRRSWLPIRPVQGFTE